MDNDAVWIRSSSSSVNESDESNDDSSSSSYKDLHEDKKLGWCLTKYKFNSFQIDAHRFFQ
jgi:hypothetical protein